MQYYHTDDAPKAIGPYSQAVEVGPFCFMSGQIAIDPATQQLIEGDITAQAQRVFQNIKAVLAARGLTLNNVAKTTVFLQSMDDFQAMNAVYAQHMGAHKPARSAVQAAKLPLGCLVEIECIAYTG